MNANLLPSVFTIEIDGTPTLTFEARNLSEAVDLPQSDGPSKTKRSDELTWKLTRSVAVTSAFGVLYRSVTPSTSSSAEMTTASYVERLQPRRKLSDLTWLSSVATSFG
jgi:hypothetical protein